MSSSEKVKNSVIPLGDHSEAAEVADFREIPSEGRDDLPNSVPNDYCSARIRERPGA
jgi:hypothetical protein